jgi:hypothetical protein
MAVPFDESWQDRNLGDVPFGVRQDDPGSIASADGKMAPLQLDEWGNLRVALPSATTAETEGMGETKVTVKDLASLLGETNSLLRRLVFGAADSDESEIVVVVDRTQLADTTAASGTVETPLNMRSDKVGGCPCPVLSAVTVNLVPDPVKSMELAHAVAVGDVQGTAATALWGQLSLNYEPLRPPFIVGPAGFYLYWGGTVATSGFAAVEFLAVPSSLLTGLA